MSQAQPLRIAIVGGGIAGLSAALAVQKHQDEGANVELKIYEQAPKFAEIGAGVAFGPNAQQALKLIGCGEALAKIGHSVGVDPDYWYDFRIAEAKHEHSGERIIEISGHNAARGSCHRADFLDQMIGRLGDQANVARFNHVCTGYTSSDDEQGVTLHFANQPDAMADVVVASDGVKSRIRESLYRKKGLDVASQVARYSEWVAWRGLISQADFRQAMGEDCSLKEMLLGHQRHILHFPVRGADMINIVGFVQDREHKKLGNRTGPWAEERPKQEMLDDFATFRPECLQLLEAIKKPSIWGIFVVPELETAIADRVALIGDAAHAMTPHQGSGAGQAIEDAVFIAALLCSDAIAKSSGTSRRKQVDRALEVYHQTRHIRGRDVQRTSREAGLLYEFCGVYGEGDDIGKLASNLQSRMRWIWEYDVERELQTAVASLAL